MRTRLERDYRFEAAHWLPRVAEDHKCRRMHGHSYHVTVAVVGEPDADSGWLLDFADIDAVVLPEVGQLDHRVLNDIDGLDNPTSERLAAWLWRRLAPGLPGLAEVTVSETPTSRCSVTGE